MELSTVPDQIVKQEEDMDVIGRFEGRYEFLSNFYPSPFLFRGLWFRTSEHAFQAQKTRELKVQKFIRDAASPSIAKAIGKTVKLRANWEEIKHQVMYDVCWQKFSTNPTLLDRLLKTEGKKLVEGNTWGDRYWGVDEYGVGKNILGQILMKIRSEIMMVYVGGTMVPRPVEVVVEKVVGPYEKKGPKDGQW